MRHLLKKSWLLIFLIVVLFGVFPVVTQTWLKNPGEQNPGWQSLALNIYRLQTLSAQTRFVDDDMLQQLKQQARELKRGITRVRARVKRLEYLDRSQPGTPGEVAQRRQKMRDLTEQIEDINMKLEMVNSDLETRRAALAREDEELKLSVDGLKKEKSAETMDDAIQLLEQEQLKQGGGIRDEDPLLANDTMTKKEAETLTHLSEKSRALDLEIERRQKQRQESKQHKKMRLVWVYSVLGAMVLAGGVFVFFKMKKG